MFEKSLEAKFKKIFDLKRVSFDVPGESHEQECLFIEITNAKSHIKDRLEISKVSGKGKVYCNNEKMPYGYFQKKIAQADDDDVADIFFFEVDDNAGMYENIAERSFSFVYFFRGQYNPELGTISQLETL